MISFELKNFPHVSMLKASAEEIFKILGKKLETTGAMLVEDMPRYLAKIQAAIEEDKQYPQDIEHIDDNGKIRIETRITLAQKSYPLRELMQNAIKTNESITYTYSKY